MKLPTAKNIHIDSYSSGLSRIVNSNNLIKLSQNETPLGPCSEVSKIIKKNLINVSRYPDGNSSLLREKLSKKFKLDKDQIIIGCGSDEIISLVCQAFLDKDDEVILSENSFLMYRIYAQINGAKVIFSKEKDNTFDIEETIKSITNKTKIIFIANPNNPTGTYLNKEDILKLRSLIPSHILLMIDDAYAEFMISKDFRSGLDLFKDFKNVIVCRTFSKIYGIANLRLGWGYSSKEIVKSLNLIRPPFNISGVTQAAGVASLSNQKWLNKNIKHNIKWSKIFYKKLSEKKFIINKPCANFFLMNCDNLRLNSDDVFNIFLKYNILLRKMTSYRIKNSLRVSIGNDKENKKFLKILENKI
tara:strand:+ start:25982 stop:27058 length:1077 start_codon:yes stop_codon:yes gene_type:complete